MKSFLTLLFLGLALVSCAQKKTYNVNGESIDRVNKVPTNWIFAFNDQQKASYNFQLDSTVTQSGKYAISITFNKPGANFGAFSYPISSTFEGNVIQLSGYVKTSEVKSGYAGLWLRIDGKEETIAFDNMSTRGVKGTTDWTKCTIDLQYESQKAKSIVMGGLLVGDGKAWFDGFELLIDGKPLNSVPEKVLITAKADLDTAFSVNSGIKNIQLTNQIQQNLYLTGQFWGFLKYHHPAIAKGNYNWDAELFRHLPKVIAATTSSALSKVLEDWITELPNTIAGTAKSVSKGKLVAIKPDHGSLFDGKSLSKTLVAKLELIKNSNRAAEHYYISFVPGVGNPVFDNERSYTKISYPDAGYQLLSLYRYWAMINYFFPYKDIIGANWNESLNERIPEFVGARNQKEYSTATLKLIAAVHDTHANVWSTNPGLEEFKGKFKLPFRAEFIENKLVITAFNYGEVMGVSQKLQVGDVISTINGKKVEDLVKLYLPYTAASNYDTQLRDLPSAFLLRGNVESFDLVLNRDGKAFTETIKALGAANYPSRNTAAEKSGFKLLESGIGYVYPGSYKNADLPAIKTLFKDSKGIIVDMRCYPSEFMPFTFGNYIKQNNTPFVKFTTGQLAAPGTFTFNEPLKNGGGTEEFYKGKVVVIVNATSQSQAEYTTMAFQSSPNVTVIGSTTAAADGNVSRIVLPGGISTMISGIGVFYPDGTPTQRVGVKLDRVLKPTLKGVIAGRDELLETATNMILSKK
ncbi:MAG: S41 family peptidase [Bacteroidota bacterium]